jgi:hypothetical protein
VTIILPLQPQEEARLIAMAQQKGISTDALVREALGRILADASDREPDALPSRPATGAALVAAMLPQVATSG